MNWYDSILSLQFTWRDAVDVLIVSFVIYNILALIRGTRAMQVSIGLVVLGSSFFVARAFDLPALEAISRQILFYLPFAVIVLFQAEIRRALARMASNPLLSLVASGASPVPFDAIVGATTVLSAQRIGALIAIERGQNIEAFAESGVKIDCALSTELAVSIFFPKTPLHDGGIIIRSDRIVSAACIFPITQRADLDRALGLRHRAALGLTEESDAIVICVSEETGIVSICHRGFIERSFDPESFDHRLGELFSLHDESDSKQLAGKTPVPGTRRHSVAGHPSEPGDDRLAF